MYIYQKGKTQPVGVPNEDNSGIVLTETELIRSAREGDSTAWQALMQAHHEPVFRFAYLLLHDPDDAEDAAQESFVRAYRAIDRFDETRSFRPWLFGITANLARNRRRSIGRYTTAVQKWWGRRTEIAPQPVEDLTGSQIEAQTLWEAIRRLRRDDQAVIYMRFFLDMSVNETAEALDLAPGTVKSRLSRALVRLREVIRADFPELAAEG